MAAVLTNQHAEMQLSMLYYSSFNYKWQNCRSLTYLKIKEFLHHIRLSLASCPPGCAVPAMLGSSDPETWPSVTEHRKKQRKNIAWFSRSYVFKNISHLTSEKLFLQKPFCICLGQSGPIYSR